MEIKEIRVLNPIINEMDDNIDVHIIMSTGVVYTGTFFTYTNVKNSILESDSYFWSINTLIVHRLTKDIIRAHIKDVFLNGELGLIFHEET